VLAQLADMRCACHFLGSRRKALILTYPFFPASCWFASSVPSGILLVHRFYCAAYFVFPCSQRLRDYAPQHRRPQVSLVGPGLRRAAVWPWPQVAAAALGWPLVVTRLGWKRVTSRVVVRVAAAVFFFLEPPPGLSRRHPVRS